MFSVSKVPFLVGAKEKLSPRDAFVRGSVNRRNECLGGLFNYGLGAPRGIYRQRRIVLR